MANEGVNGPGKEGVDGCSRCQRMAEETPGSATEGTGGKGGGERVTVPQHKTMMMQWGGGCGCAPGGA